MYLCFYTYPKTKVEQSQSNTISFYLLIVRKSTIVYFSACELLHNCYMVVFLFTQTQNLNNHIVMPFLVILRLPRSEQQVFFIHPALFRHCYTVVFLLTQTQKSDYQCGVVLGIPTISNIRRNRNERRFLG